jgi:positive phototaxis protein PixI
MLPSLNSALTAISLDALTLDPIPADTRQPLLRFSLGPQDTALVVLEQLVEILRVPVTEILPVPETAGCVLGVCNWRGKMLWAIDLDDLVGYPSPLQPEQDPLFLHLMVVQLNDQFMGLGVRQVHDIELHELQQLQPVTPGLFPPRLQPFVLGTLPGCDGAVLQVTAITQCPLWQMDDDSVS